MLKKIKAAQLQARKNRESSKASFLTTLIGEAEMVGKSKGNRESTNEEILVIIKKFENNINENIKIYTEKGIPDRLADAKFELEVLKEFLPEKLTDLQVQKDVGSLITALGLPKVQKSMGIVGAELKARYGNQYDGGQVSKMFKTFLV